MIYGIAEHVDIADANGANVDLEGSTIDKTAFTSVYGIVWVQNWFIVEGFYIN
jgi:hypothetical protein